MSTEKAGEMNSLTPELAELDSALVSAFKDIGIGCPEKCATLDKLNSRMIIVLKHNLTKKVMLYQAYLGLLWEATRFLQKDNVHMYLRCI